LKAIAWGITGAGALLEESVECIERLLRRGVRVTVFVSRAGEEVLKFYGLRDRVESTLKGPYPTGVVYESREPPSYPSVGRVYLGVYEAVVISPATMNTVGKIVSGVADSLVSNLAMHAIKARVPVYVVPVDAHETRSLIPAVIDRSKCERCPTPCIAARRCPTGALREHEYYVVDIDLGRCTRCYVCVKVCPLDALKFDVELVVRPHPYYLEIIERLKAIEGVYVLKSSVEVLRHLGVTP
jgi:dihydromethanopterin reductase (acceptor)